MIQQTYICPHCKSQNPISWEFCGKCGVRISMFVCDKCGSKTIAGQRFCVGCGEELPMLCPNCDNIVTPYQKKCKNCGLQLVWQSPNQLVAVSNLQESSWVQRNPNFILILGLVVGIMFALPLMFLPDDMILSWFLLGIGILTYWSLAGWALHMKGQSLAHLWWILLSVIPGIGSLITLIIWMSLENKKKF